MAIQALTPEQMMQQGMQQRAAQRNAKARTGGDVALNLLAGYFDRKGAENRKAAATEKATQEQQAMSAALQGVMALPENQRGAAIYESGNENLIGMYNKSQLGNMFDSKETEKPFGTGANSSLMYTALHGDINDANTIAAFQELGADKSHVDNQTGRTTTIKGYVPEIIRKRFESPKNEGGDGKVVDERITITDPTRAPQSELKQYRDEFGAIDATLQSLDNFGASLEEHGVQAGFDIGGISFSLDTKARQALNTAYTGFMGELKGPKMLGLGVLTGPDLDIIEGMLPPPTELGAAFQPEKYLQGYTSAVDYINSKVKAYNNKWEGSKVPIKKFTLPRSLGGSKSGEPTAEDDYNALVKELNI